MTTGPAHSQSASLSAVEWLHEGRLAIIQGGDSSKEGVDAWADATLDVLKNWDKSKTYLVLHDITSGSLTPYSRQRSMEFRDYTKYLKGRYAMLVASGLHGNIISFFVNQTFRRADQSEVEGRCFTNRKEAMAWLEELLT